MRGFAILAALPLVLVPATSAVADGTMNFENVTSSNLNQTVAELNDSYVKEMDTADFDNDGDLDVVVATAGGVFGTRRNKLYRNDGGVLNEVTGSPIIPGFMTQDLTRHVYFRDADNDGWLDIVVANDDLDNGGPFKLYMNNQTGGVFSHFTEEGAARGLGYEASCGGIAEDVDGDGWVDIYSGNYPGPSQDSLKMNDGDGTFSLVTSTHVPPDGDYTIDVGVADMNGDGKIDLLISNHDSHYVYYNDKLGAADHGVGDYRYGGSGVGGRDNLGTASDGAMEPGDFNNDGLIDFYWTNKSGSYGDRIYVNIGNDSAGRADFSVVTPPPYPTTRPGNKIGVGDLNVDGRVDIVLAHTNGRPAILRNTSVGGAVSFVDWTPAPAFPSSSVHRGHHGAIFDLDGDMDGDIFIGGDTNDHLFRNVPSNEVSEGSLGPSGGTLPNIFNSTPVAVDGTGGSGDVDVYVLNGIGSGFISAVLRSDADVRLELLNSIDTVIASSDRGTEGVEEALQANTTNGTYKLRVTVISGGASSPADLDGNGEVDFNDLVNLLASWGCTGCPQDIDGSGSADFGDVIALLAAWGPAGGPADYVLEALGRSG